MEKGEEKCIFRSMKSRDSNTKETQVHEGGMERTCHVNQRDYSFRTENRQSVYPAGCNASCRFYILENKKCPPAVCTRILFACYANAWANARSFPYLPAARKISTYIFRFLSIFFYQFPTKFLNHPCFIISINLTKKQSV